MLTQEFRLSAIFELINIHMLYSTGFWFLLVISLLSNNEKCYRILVDLKNRLPFPAVTFLPSVAVQVELFLCGRQLSVAIS